MNHKKVSVLDGGLPRYRVEGLELDEKSLMSEEEGLAHAQSKKQVRILVKPAFIYRPSKLMPLIVTQSEYPIPSFKRSHVKSSSTSPC